MLGQGSGSSVYRGVPESGGGQEVAIKVLEPELLGVPGFLDRFEREIRTVAGIRHPHLLRLYEYGSSSGVTGLAMELARGGTLGEELDNGPVSLGRAIHLMEAIASALEAAHGAGLVHRDIKPTNILLDERRQPKVADFGLARAHFTYAVGTPGYLAPELALGQQVDRRCDVYSLAVLAFEMLTGRQPYADQAGPNLIVATVTAPVPRASALRADLPRETDAVFMRALAKSPDDRHPTTQAFAEDLARALRRESRPAREPRLGIGPTAPLRPVTTNNHVRPEAQPGPDEASLMRAFQTALSAAVVVDETGFVVAWNPKAEELFGWTRDEMIGRSLASTIIPARHREAHERGFRRYLATGQSTVMGHVIEVSAMHRDGSEFPVELSISPIAHDGTRTPLVGFVRDLTKEKNAERFRAAMAEVSEVLGAKTGLDAALPRVFQAVGTSMDWSTGAYWRPEADRLVCRLFWKAEGFECPDFEQATLDAKFWPGVGLAGRVWVTGEPIWVPDVLDEPTMTRALLALRAGLHCAIVFPVLRSGEVAGAVELLAREIRKQDDELLMRFFDVGRRLGRLDTTENGDGLLPLHRGE